MIQGIEHTAIASPDPAALAAWYVNTLGFEINYRGTTAVFIKAPDRTMIEIIQSEGERVAQALKSPGLRHLALTVTDFAAVYQTLQTRGVTFLGEPLKAKGNQVVFFEDPEGNILHLLQRETPLP
jgi:glyoxylase I family protein